MINWKQQDYIWRVTSNKNFKNYLKKTKEKEKKMFQRGNEIPYKRMKFNL